MDCISYRSQSHRIRPVAADVILPRDTRGDGEEQEGDEGEEGREGAQAQLELPPAVLLAQSSSSLALDGQRR